MAFSGYQDFVPAFGGSLQRFLAANPGITVTSGYRSPERQAALFKNAVAKYGSEAAARHWVAPPGRSHHNMGDAADLHFTNDAARQWAHDNAAKYGLAFPMGHEPWHVELVGARDGNPAPDAGAAVDTSSVASLFAPPPDQAPGLDLSGLAGKQQDQGGPVALAGQQNAAPLPTIDVAPVAPAMLAPPQQQASLGLDDLAPLADLFKVKTIGQAGTLPGRKF